MIGNLMSYINRDIKVLDYIKKNNQSPRRWIENKPYGIPLDELQRRLNYNMNLIDSLIDW